MALSSLSSVASYVVAFVSYSLIVLSRSSSHYPMNAYFRTKEHIMPWTPRLLPQSVQGGCENVQFAADISFFAGGKVSFLIPWRLFADILLPSLIPRLNIQAWNPFNALGIWERIRCGTTFGINGDSATSTGRRWTFSWRLILLCFCLFLLFDEQKSSSAVPTVRSWRWWYVEFSEEWESDSIYSTDSSFTADVYSSW